MDSHLLVVCIKQVKNIAFETPSASHTLILETRFHDETLTLDPIEVTRATDEPIDISSELAWILSKKCLHEAKIKRLPVKLQVYLFDAKVQEKRLLGYHVFDIRSVQETSTPKFEWKPLLNAKYKGSSSHRPEILCALQVTRDDTCESASNHPNNGCASSRLLTDLQVKETDNVIKIWDANVNSEDDCKECFLFSIVIATVNHLDQFYTKIAKEKDQPNFPVERITFKIASTSASSVKSYFDLNPMCEITLCSKKDQSCIPLAFTSIFLRSLCASGKNEPIVGEFNLQPVDETLDAPCNASIGLCVELESVSHHHQSSQLNTILNGSPSKSIKSFNHSVDCDDVHHYCFSIDLRSITPTDGNFFTCDSSYFLQFSYTIFGQTDMITTSSVNLTAVNSAVTFTDGYFAFNFASSWNQLATSLSHVPIVFELVQAVSPAKSIIRGLCKLYLTDIIESPPDLENKKLIVKKPSIRDPRDCQLATINCILCLQDLGVVCMEATSLPPLDLSILHRHLTSPHATASASKPGNILQKLFIDAAIEIELWKQFEMAKFTQKLASKNKATVNGGTGENGTHSALSDLPSNDYSHLKQLTEVLKAREMQIDAKQAELTKASEVYKEKYDKLQEEISTAIEEIKGVFEEKLSKERSVINKLEEQNRKLSDEIVALKSQLKSSSLTSSLVRINSVPNSVRSASKVRPGVTKQTLNDQQVKSSKLQSANKDNRQSKPASPLSKNSSTMNVRRSPLVTPTKGTSLNAPSAGDRKSIVLQELKSERDTMLKKGLCRSDDPMIKTIEKELRRHGVRTK